MSPQAIPQEAQKFYEKALDIWPDGKKFNELDEDTVREMKGYLALAIKKAGGPYLEAEEAISEVLMMNGEIEDALTHANLAIYYDPFSFAGQYVRVAIYLSKVKEMKLHFDDFIDLSGGALDNIFSSYTRSIISIVKSRNAKKTQVNLHKELLTLISIYRNNCMTMTDPVTFVDYSNKMMLVAKIIENVKISPSRPNLYQEIVNAPIKLLNKDGHEKEVEEILAKAEGQSELFKP